VSCERGRELLDGGRVLLVGVDRRGDEVVQPVELVGQLCRRQRPVLLQVTRCGAEVLREI
jgi:hypothetical protein